MKLGRFSGTNSCARQDAPLKHRINSDAYKTLFPFFLIIGVVLLLVWRLILSPGLSYVPPSCPGETKEYIVQPGDNCWEISKARGCTLDELAKLNEKLDCEVLMPGMQLCLPSPKTPESAGR